MASEYFTEPDIELTTENTANILSEYSFWQHYLLCQSLRVPDWELQDESATPTTD